LRRAVTIFPTTCGPARLLRDAPEEIVAVHAAFFRAGAAFATTASYQASFEGFAACGIDRNMAVKLIRRSVELARTARDVVGGGWVAASVGPQAEQFPHGRVADHAARLGRITPAAVSPPGCFPSR
jgi:S-methylmethionine-dependent homocysteine/selenocysteine methylase